MATNFHDRKGRVIATRSWGGEREGVRVTLCPAAADFLTERGAMNAKLHGDDGSKLTLAEVCEQIGVAGYLHGLGIRLRG